MMHQEVENAEVMRVGLQNDHVCGTIRVDNMLSKNAEKRLK